MTDVSLIAFGVSLIGTVVGATWVLRGALSGIENALQSHVAEDRVMHKALDERVVKLEAVSAKSRRRR